MKVREWLLRSLCYIGIHSWWYSCLHNYKYCIDCHKRKEQ